VTPLLDLLKVESINRFVFAVRFFFYVRVRRRIRVHSDDRAVISQAYSNLMLKRGITSDRPLRLIRPLSVIDGIDKRRAKVLSIGCRYETELLYLLGYGFRHVRGLDMISYSPWVDLGNMHALEYPASSWDAVLLGWVISYSEQPQVAATEVARVTRNGGLIAVGVSYYPPTQLEEAERKGTIIGKKEGRIQTADAILKLFHPFVDRVYYSHDAPSPSVESYCAVVFSIRK
jgi:SAM-dependent methyltransferase